MAIQRVAPAGDFKLRPGMLVIGDVNGRTIPGKIKEVSGRDGIVVDFSGDGYGFTRAMRRSNLQVVLTRPRTAVVQ